METSEQIDRHIATIARISSVPTILQVITETTGMRFAAVAHVSDTQWVALAVHDLIDFGLKPGGELVLESTICHEIRQHRRPVVFGQASTHPVFAHHHTPAQYGLESYISVPIIRRNGEFFGTLCAIDPLPANIETAAVLNTFKLFAELIAGQLDNEERADRADAALADANAMAELRDQFVAVLGHDLRNPLQTLSAGSQILARRVPDADAQRLLLSMQRACQRMGTLIGNVLDFALDRIGGGLTVTMTPEKDLGAELEQIVAEVRISHPERRIEARIDVRDVVYCDASRIGQLFGNLLSNAIVHGDEGTPIFVEAASRPDVFALSVENSGREIPPESVAGIFKPFKRSDSGQPGLGLGLYIAETITRAHGGTLTVESGNRRTRFALRIPNQAIAEERTRCLEDAAR